ncbi:MAG: site-specific integrase [Chloroflexi bacterium]|nr:site-specific integrase [Chloroflexota bacterium]
MSQKRGQNEGSIYKRKDGRWTAQVTIEGKHILKYFKTRRECRDWVDSTRNQIDNGLTLQGAQTTLATYMADWLITVNTTVRPKTIFQYEQIFRQHIAPTLGNIKLKDLRPDQIQALYNAKLKSGVSARSVIMIHAVLHRALNHALKMGMIGRNPVDAVTRPKFKHKEMNTFDENQVRSLLSVVQGTRSDALYYIAITTGMRQGELLGLKWSDIDWRNRSIHVQRQVQRTSKGGLGFCEPKSEAGKRTIVLGRTVFDKLRAQIDILEKEKAEAGDKWQEFDLIFPSTVGTPLDHRNVYRDYKEILNVAGLPDLRFHDLRHTAATLMFKQGVHPKVVQERLGHADITLTLNTYSHVLPSMQDEAAEKMDEMLNIIDVSKELKKVKDAQPSYWSPS